MSHELEKLAKENSVNLTDQDDVELTTKGQSLIEEALHSRLAINIELLIQKYGHLHQAALVSTVCEKYSRYCSNSQFVKGGGVEVANSQPANYTIGYQEFQVDGLLNELLQAGIKRLIDTRSNPMSRR